ncbi:MAG: Phosphoglucosamine mutase [Candidatus Amesbacteria bacterium GW2011_GWB1_47_26]|uniref:Phosphoglucosamine mutase n=1 Tax=Candidatus Amesbacteria bacterium GW2011_GWC2_45_19 TaxID=1618366 RepID=A0A0G1M5F0_9BACT|nr:MAG: Phosphoglucosamine mutase [Candidatus Amesbacteria bacterium GW2011_GWC2_45_19]KKU38020.1 MAG: Phosphoglucosamine mutase [Candidatus Amesbacteria bacterium GW2011_GWA1_46_35]KKU68966.1 MAG: Phosphoglucosamine mutase [Microgenomates group bacterium GW2011_GWC1_47_20]KKU73606.1 MAG: Phosphoglucosamine mutase [Candidatus Amesbacteria bacterium GW2011_GWB1_47_26]KKU79196.1 MAG: Phosphoglucosamine mutase [Candidatus Amesbacteria bacterium GW2011_GWA2_47_70]
MPKLFGTSGIRGPADTLFTKQFCVKLGAVFGAWLTSKGREGYVAVAMDPRESSPFIKRHLLQGLAFQGWEILDEGVIPTPALTYFVKQSPAVGGGVMVTGSHIAKDLNGVKLFIDGEEVTKAHELEIEQLFNSAS